MTSKIEDRLIKALPHIQASLERSNPSDNTIDGIIQDILCGEAHLWLGENSAIVTQPVYGHRIWHAGGEFSEMVEIMTRAWAIMEKHGAQELRIDNTRKGWLKQLRPHGFDQVVSLIKEA